jgi:hypothetical protein
MPIEDLITLHLTTDWNCRALLTAT